MIYRRPYQVSVLSHEAKVSNRLPTNKGHYFKSCFFPHRHCGGTDKSCKPSYTDKKILTPSHLKTFWGIKDLGKKIKIICLDNIYKKSLKGNPEFFLCFSLKMNNITIKMFDTLLYSQYPCVHCPFFFKKF